MLLTIISIATIIISIGYLFVYEKIEDRVQNKKIINLLTGVGIISITLTIVSILVTLICLALIIKAHINTEYQFAQDMTTYYVITSGDYITTSDDVIEYNNMVMEYANCGVSPWTNWFYYDGCENLPYIPMEVEYE